MTGSEWLSPREKRRLFDCACLRGNWHLLEDRRLRNAVKVAERYAGGRTTGEELRAACIASIWAYVAASFEYLHVLLWEATRALPTVAFYTLRKAGWGVFSRAGAATALEYLEGTILSSPLPRRRAFFRRLEVLFGAEAASEVASAEKDTPSGPVGVGVRTEALAEISRVVLTHPAQFVLLPCAALASGGDAIRNLARELREGVEMNRLGLLAVALEAAGCDDRVLLEHLRTPHARDCWVLDLVLDNPRRRNSVNPAWLTPEVRSLAAANTETNAPGDPLDPACVAVLSDALEEAGCDDMEMLTHLRCPGPHVRGCWVVDMILDRS